MRRWQRRIEPLHKRIFGGCHLTKAIVDLITAAGLTVSDLDVFYQKGTPKFGGADSLGTALSPATPGAAIRLDDCSTLGSDQSLDSNTRRLAERRSVGRAPLSRDSHGQASTEPDMTFGAHDWD